MGQKFLPASRKVAAGVYGYGAVLGASLVGGLLESILGLFIKPLRKIFLPIVTGTVVISIGLSLIPLGIAYFAGGFGSSDFGSVSNLFLGTLVIVVILFLMQFTKGFFKVSAVLTGIIVGYIVAIFMGKVDFTHIARANWFSLPQLFAYKME